MQKLKFKKKNTKRPDLIPQNISIPGQAQVYPHSEVVFGNPLSQEEKSLD
ncbi:MAG: hypothetical protein P8Z71_02045 [Candidatus Sulfobium sp.]